MASTASPIAWLPPRGTHNITIGSSIRRSLSRPHASSSSHDGEQSLQPLRNDFVAMRYNLKPPAVANAAGSLVSQGSYGQKDSFQLDLNAETGERHSFTARSEAKKEVDCVLFYDPTTGTLVLERLDSLLSLTHQRSPSTSILQNNSTTTTTPNNRLPLNRPSPSPAAGPAGAATAPVVAPATTTGAPVAAATALHLPPTPPSTSPPEYTALPESTRSKNNQQQKAVPRAPKLKPARAVAAPKKANPGADIQPRSHQQATATHYASSDTAASVLASPGPSVSREQGKSAQARSYLAKSSTASDFASEPDEEVMAFGSGRATVMEPPEEDEDMQMQLDNDDDMMSMPASNNALRLSDIPSRRTKRKFSDSEPDEEVLEFGRPAQEIKRPKTASQSPASISNTPAATGSDYATATAGVSPHSRPAPYQSIPSRSSAAALSYGNKLVHGSSPLASAMVLSSNSSDDDDSDDDEFEEVLPISATIPAPTGDGDGDDDDFLAAAFNNDDDGTGMHDGAASDHSDDTSDESDYEER